MTGEFELIECEKRKSPESIRYYYWRKFEYGDNILLGIATDKGAAYVRKYYNNINLRKRKK